MILLKYFQKTIPWFILPLLCFPISLFAGEDNLEARLQEWNQENWFQIVPIENGTSLIYQASDKVHLDLSPVPSIQFDPEMNQLTIGDEIIFVEQTEGVFNPKNPQAFDEAINRFFPDLQLAKLEGDALTFVKYDALKTSTDWDPNSVSDELGAAIFPEAPGASVVLRNGICHGLVQFVIAKGEGSVIYVKGGKIKSIASDKVYHLPESQTELLVAGYQGSQPVPAGGGSPWIPAGGGLVIGLLGGFGISWYRNRKAKKQKKIPGQTGDRLRDESFMILKGEDPEDEKYRKIAALVDIELGLKGLILDKQTGSENSAKLEKLFSDSDPKSGLRALKIGKALLKKGEAKAALSEFAIGFGLPEPSLEEAGKEEKETDPVLSLGLGPIDHYLEEVKSILLEENGQNAETLKTVIHALSKGLKALDQLHIENGIHSPIPFDAFTVKLQENVLLHMLSKDLAKGDSTEEALLRTKETFNQFLSDPRFSENRIAADFYQERIEPAFKHILEMRDKMGALQEIENYLKASESRFGNLLNDLDGEITDDEWIEKLVTMALHWNEYLQIHSGRPLSSRNKLNASMILQEKEVKDLADAEYGKFSEKVGEIPSRVKRFRDIGKKMDLKKLDGVLVDGFYIAPEHLN